MKFFKDLNPKTKRVIVFIVIIFISFIGLQIYSHFAVEEPPEAPETASAVVDTVEDEPSEEIPIKKYTFNDFTNSLNFGWGNVILFAFLIIILAVAKNKQKRDFENPKEEKPSYEEDNEE